MMKIPKSCPTSHNKTAQEIIGRAFVANIISLGVIAELTNVVTKESLERAVLNRVPPATEEINKEH